MQSIIKLSAESVRPSLFVALFLGYLISTIIYRIFFHPLHKIPGPFVAKFTELWRTRKYFGGNWHQDILDLHRKYGPVVRLSPSEVSFVDKDALIAVYGHVKGAKKTNWYDVWKVFGAPNSFFNSTDPKEHSFLRKRVTSAYSMTAILHMESRIQEVSDALWPCFREFARNGTTIALHDWVPFFAFDVVGKVALGDAIGFVAARRDPEGIIAAIHNYFFWSANVGYLPGQQRILFHPFTQKIVGWLGVKADGTTFFGGWLKNQIRRRRERGPPADGDEGDMLDHFIAMKNADGTPVPDAAVFTECGNIIGAGADTTAIGIRAVLGQLMLHADSYARVREEVDAAYALHALSDEPGAGGIPFAVAEKLPFLDACVKEALRLHPSILWQLPREVPPQGLSVRGHYIPAGATVSMSPIAQNRCVEVFGADADEWRPERWIAGEGADERGVREMNKFNTTFGYGSRTCVGKNLALVEIYKFTAELLHQFDVELASKEKPWVLKSMWFSDQGEMFVKIKERS